MTPVPYPSAAPSRRMRLLLTCIATSTLVLTGTGLSTATAADSITGDGTSLAGTGAVSGDDLLREGVMVQLAGTVDPAFYSPPAALPAANGTPVRSEPATFYLDPVKLIQPAATATRIMYKSTDSFGKPVAVTGTILVPTKAWTGSGSRPVIGYAVGTQGLADKCAPSRQMAVGQEYEGPMMSALLNAGYALSITDYEGLGTPGPHAYLVRASAAHSLIDSVRAAQQLGIPGITAANPVALVGYSQGGGASAAAAELAPSYAPELNLKGAYGGAVPAELPSVAKNLDSGLYTAFELYAASAIGAVYGMAPETYLNAKGVEELAAAGTECTIEAVGQHAFVNTASLTLSGQKLTSVLTEPRFQAVLAEQEIGVGRSPKVPVLLSHSLLDDVVPYQTGRDLAKRWCDREANVSWDTTLAPTHIGGYVAAVPRVMLFLNDRFAGRSQVSSCWRI
jgi:pimeloyl-ACP methyl ester carboxylesterase